MSDEAYREILPFLTDHQRELEKAMQQREHKGEETDGRPRLRQGPQADLLQVHPSWII